MKTLSRKSGLSLVEIVISTTVMVLLFLPLFSVFSSSFKLTGSGANLNQATILANNLMSAVKAVHFKNPYDFGKLAGQNLMTANPDLQNIGITGTSADFQTFPGVTTIHDPDLESCFHQVNIDVKWKSIASGKERNYRLSTVLDCVQ